MSNTESDNEYEDVPSHIPYSHRPDWSDVKPIEQDDGPHPVVKIAYSDRFCETFDYIRACMKSNEMSERALELTKDACQLNPANYTVWCYRRQLLKHLNSDLHEELSFIEHMIRDNPKNYQVNFSVPFLISIHKFFDLKVWEHRRLIVERSGFTAHELAFLSAVIKNDSKNYHAWQYRQWLLSTYSLWLDELKYVDELLDDDIRNNSAWNQRYFVIAHTTGFKDEIIERELDYVEKRIESCPDNESAWNYLRGIVRFRSTNLNDQRVWNFCQNLYENKYQKDDFNSQQWRFLLAYMIELLVDDDRKEKEEENKKLIQQFCEALALKIDPIRKKYWQYIQEQHSIK